jgi:apolipoprotein D and lipocalin family protein
MKTIRLIATTILIAGLTACSSQPPMPTVAQVDLPRFMGDWYVIANIPTFLEKDAYNPVESYALNADGTIATTFTFNAGSFEGEEKVYHPQGFIRNTATNAEWGMQFIWPIKADYRIVYIDEDYQYTVIGRNSRDYVWIMARTAQIPDQTYGELRDFVIDLGYDPELLQKAPQQVRK